MWWYDTSMTSDFEMVYTPYVAPLGECCVKFWLRSDKICRSRCDLKMLPEDRRRRKKKKEEERRKKERTGRITVASRLRTAS